MVVFSVERAKGERERETEEVVLWGARQNRALERCASV